MWFLQFSAVQSLIVNTVFTSIYNERPKSDKVLVDIVDYVMSYKVRSQLAYETARTIVSFDSLG